MFVNFPNKLCSMALKLDYLDNIWAYVIRISQLDYVLIKIILAKNIRFQIVSFTKGPFLHLMYQYIWHKHTVSCRGSGTVPVSVSTLLCLVATHSRYGEYPHYACLPIRAFQCPLLAPRQSCLYQKHSVPTQGDYWYEAHHVSPATGSRVSWGWLGLRIQATSGTNSESPPGLHWPVNSTTIKFPQNYSIYVTYIQVYWVIVKGIFAYMYVVIIWLRYRISIQYFDSLTSSNNEVILRHNLVIIY